MTGPPQVDYKTENGITTVTRWYSPGRMFSFSEWKADTEEYEDERHGVSRKWDEEGQLVYEAHFKDGKLHGTKRMWWENGNLCSHDEYNEGKQIGMSRAYHKNGVLSFEAGEGVYRVYDRCGVLRERTRLVHMWGTNEFWEPLRRPLQVWEWNGNVLEEWDEPNYYYILDYEEDDTDDIPRFWDEDEDYLIESPNQMSVA
jgi:hypothetical protein